MDIVYAPQKSIAVIRWPVDEFFQVKQDPKNLDSEHFSLNGLSSKFFLQIYQSWTIGYLHYYLYVDEMSPKKEFDYTTRFWLENINGEKCAETEGIYFQTLFHFFLAQTRQVSGDYNKVECFPKVLTGEQVLSKATFFESGKAIVCCEITHKVFDDVVEKSNPDAEFRQKLWDCCENGFHDSVTIKAEGKKFKVCYLKNRINIYF
jgi:hypothetical protein